jgi:hypothetical protein
MCNWCEVGLQYHILASTYSALQEPRVFDSHSYRVTNDFTANEELVRVVRPTDVELAVSTPWWGSATFLRLTAHVGCVTDINEVTQLFWYCQVSYNGWPSIRCTS